MLAEKKTPEFDFYAELGKIQGWLMPVAGKRTRELLEWQTGVGIKGSLLEIGVFCGKYFALLVEAAKRDGGHALGIDTFEFAPQKRVISEMDKLFGEDIRDCFTLWGRPSSTVRANQILSTIGAPRFVSIDGAHDYENVFRDLELVETILSPSGIVAVDDFLNPKTLGVNQAVNAFYARPRKMVPVAYISNKLFLAHASREEEYRDAIESLIVAGDDPQSASFREFVEKGRSHVEQPFFGHRVILS